MSNWESVHTEQRGDFTIQFSITPEDDDPAGHFASGDDAADAETVRKIHDGTYLWFVARVTASKAGVELAEDYLGGCCYKSAREFMQPGGYYDDMVTEAVTRAATKLEELSQ